MNFPLTVLFQTVMLTLNMQKSFVVLVNVVVVLVTSIGFAWTQEA